MSLGLPNYGPKPNRQYTFFSSIRVRSSHTARDSNVIATTKEDNDRLRLQELEALDDWLQAQQHIELYQARISKGFNKKVK